MAQTAHLKARKKMAHKWLKWSIRLRNWTQIYELSQEKSVKKHRGPKRYAKCPDF